MLFYAEVILYSNTKINYHEDLGDRFKIYMCPPQKCRHFVDTANRPARHSNTCSTRHAVARRTSGCSGNCRAIAELRFGWRTAFFLPGRRMTLKDVDWISSAPAQIPTQPLSRAPSTSPGLGEAGTSLPTPSMHPQTFMDVSQRRSRQGVLL